MSTTAATGGPLLFQQLACGIDLAGDALPDRNTVAIVLRIFAGAVDEPEDRAGLNAITERVLSKGTQRYAGRALADAFDRLGAQWGTASGRQSTLVRALCLPEYVLDVLDLLAEMLCRPTFPPDACDVAIQLAGEQLRLLEDDPNELLRILSQRITLGPLYGRYVGGTPEGLSAISRDDIVAHWQRNYHAGRMQIAVAGPIDPAALTRRIEDAFGGLGAPQRSGRDPALPDIQPRREHQVKDLAQNYLALTLPGSAKTDPRFAAEQVLVGVLSGGMSGRLFTEVREKQGLVYWVSAWGEQLRGSGVLNLGASTTPQRSEQTLSTLLRELERVGEDLTEAETVRARDGLIAQMQTEDDLTRARASGLSDDLFHFGRPIGLDAKLEQLRRVSVADVEQCVRGLQRDRLCVATLGPKVL